MVSKDADTAVREEIKDFWPPMYGGDLLSLDCFLKKLDELRMTVTEDMEPPQPEKYVYKQFRWRVPEMFQELYFVTAREGKTTTLEDARKRLNEQEWVDAPQVAAKRWRAFKLHQDGKDIRLREWRDFRGD